MTEQAVKPRRGCFFYGCITSLVLLVLLLAAGLIGLHYMKKLVNRYTDTQPMKLPAVQMPPGEVRKLKQRFGAFEQAVGEHRPAPTLALTADDINALVSSVLEQQPTQGNIHVTLEGDRMRGQVSVPMQEIGLSMFKGRYLNGSATFNLAFRDGALFVTAQTVTVKGKPLPEALMQAVRREPGGSPGRGTAGGGRAARAGGYPNSGREARDSAEGEAMMVRLENSGVLFPAA
ncbi:MAG TPA: hypothetical protein P5205_05910 [Candidatus Paceibacterota bacterium]|nr:hypothetical protein [Verrucomicrobiota bacterium]HSA09888.1 hypothetical protein [Candidatus Paceibacterota bacterium]